MHTFSPERPEEPHAQRRLCRSTGKGEAERDGRKVASLGVRVVLKRSGHYSLRKS